MADDPLTALLRRAPLSDAQRATLWDAYQAAATPDDLATALKPLQIPNPLKADLWDLKAAPVAAAQGAPAPLPGDAAASSWADWLPTAGGVIGGMVGRVPGARTVTAGIGGAAGEGYRQLVRHAGEIPGAVVDVARNLVTEPGATLAGFREGAAAGAKQAAIQGAIQAAGQGVGEVGVRVASKASPWLMNRALNLTDKLSREFPNMSSTMIDQALTVSRGGLEKARALLKVAKGKANAALTQAQSAGATVPITAATDGLQKTLIEVLNSADIEGGLATLAAVERQIGGGRARTLTPVAADALKRSLQTQSKQLYTAAKMGQGKPNVSVRAQALADMAESLNDALGTITTNAGAEGYRAANASAAELIGAVRGISKGIRPGANLYQAMVRPGVGAVLGGVSGAQTGGWEGGVAGTLVGGAMTSPAGMSRIAVALSRPGVQAILRESPRLAAAIASLQAMEGQEP
jgi:hypothetical protein